MSASDDPSGEDRSGPEGELAIPGEDRDRLAAAESDAAYRWAAGAVAGLHILACGCGRGHGARVLLDAGARSVVGTDPDPRSVEIAIRLHGERIRFLEAEALALPLAAGSFDVVVCLDAPEATFDPIAVVAELRRVLAEGGILLLSLPLSVAPIEPSPESAKWWRDLLAGSFENVHLYRRRASLAATVAPEGEPEAQPIASATWLTGGQGEDRTMLAAASDAELPALDSVASMVSFRDLRAQQETLAAWEQRARVAEADGSAKHWELVAAREAQRRLRMRLHTIEHRPLRILSRVLRGKPARLGPGPPIRASEHRPQRWD